MTAWECNCGWVNLPARPVCPNCSAPQARGTRLGGPPASIEPKPEAPRPSSGGAAIASVLVILIIIFLALGALGALVAAAKQAPRPALPERAIASAGRPMNARNANATLTVRTQGTASVAMGSQEPIRARSCPPVPPARRSYQVAREATAG